MSQSRSASALVGSLLILLFGAPIASAQQTPPTARAQQAGRGSITGTVRGETGDAPLDGVQVSIVGTSLGGITNAEGRYTIANVSPGVYVVQAARIGYAPGRQENVEVNAGRATTVDLRLNANALRLQSVIVAGVSDPTSGVKVPFVVTKLTAEDIPVPSTGSAAAMLKGKVAGVTVRGGAAPGSEPQIQLRNPLSVRSGTGPMYIVDGVIMNDAFAGSTNEIDPSDIASIEVIKGAAASALYGSKAGNGVISITTNRGQNIPQDAARYTMRSELGFSRLGHQIPLTTHHRWLVNADGKYIDAAGNEVERSQRIVDPNGFVDNAYGYPTYDRMKEFFGTGETFVGSLTIGQRSLATNFLGTLGGTRETGVLRDAEGLNRQNVRLNVDHRAGDKFSVGLGAYYQRLVDKTLSGSGGANVFRDFIDIERDVDLLAPNEDGTPYMRNPDPLETSIINPLYRESIRDARQERGGTQANVNANYRLNNFLSFSGQLGYQKVDIMRKYFLPAGVVTSGTVVSTGQLQRGAAFNEAVNGDIGTSVIAQWGDFNLRSRLAFLGEVSKGEGWNTIADSLTVASVEDLDFGLDQYLSPGPGMDTGHEPYDRRAKSLLSNTALEYKARYILEGVFRRDGNSRYGPANRWQSNGRLSGAWRMAEEAWWPVAAIDEFKLRYSIGSAGNNPLLNDQFHLFSPVNGRIIKTAMGNVDLIPEKVVEQEMGVDMSIDNRFGIELTYARQKSTNLLRANEISAYTGFDTQVQNVGTILGHTYEGTVEAHWYSTPKFRWSTNLVADRSRSKIVKYNREACPEDTTIYCEGVTFGEMYGNFLVKNTRQLRRVHQNPASLAQFQVNDDGLLVAVGPGGSWTDARWGQTVTIDGIAYRWGMPIIQKDENGANTFGLNAQGLPDFQFGVQNHFTFGPWNAYVLLDGQWGGKNFNTTKRTYLYEGVHGDVDQTGKPEYRKKPLDYYAASSSGTTTSVSSGNEFSYDYLMEDATYLKIDELLLGYRFPGTVRWLAGTGLESGRIAVIGRNLYTFTDYTGYDPELPSTSAIIRRDGVEYPRYRTVTFQVELVF